MKKKKKKTAKDYEAMLIESVRQGLEIDEGHRAPARQYVLTARNTTVDAPPTYTSEMIRELRERLEVSQEVFAQMLNVSVGAVRSWEQEGRTPSGAIQRLLNIFDRQSDVLYAELNRLSVPVTTRRLLGTGDHPAITEAAASGR